MNQRTSSSAAIPLWSPLDGPGLLHWIFPAMLVMPAAEVLWMQRDLALSFEHLQALSPPARPMALVVLQRALSLLIVVASLLQMSQYAMRVPGMRGGPGGLLVGGFGLYWVGTIGLPALFGAYPWLTHELLYPLLAGLATCLVTPRQGERILRTARDTLLALMAGGLVLALARPGLAMDLDYSEGWLPGLPRLAGLTPHPVAQGMLAQLGLLLLAVRPLPHRWLHRGAWWLAFTVLVLAQSKTAWLAWVACAGCLRAMRPAAGQAGQGLPEHAGRIGLRTGTIALACSLAIVAAAAGLVLTLAPDAASMIGPDLTVAQSAQLATFTGRDQIWAAAAQEWRDHPVFGYGLTVWDTTHRLRIGLPHATHAHNQLMDDAARAGSVGVVSLVAYLALLASLSLRQARASAGLSLALFLALLLRGVSEVPLVLLGYGSDLFTHLLLIVVVVTAATAGREPGAQERPA